MQVPTARCRPAITPPMARPLGSASDDSIETNRRLHCHQRSITFYLQRPFLERFRGEAANAIGPRERANDEAPVITLTVPNSPGGIEVRP